jgi:hypothetical protein
VTTKKNDCPRPLPHTGHKENRCLWYINNLSVHFHYENHSPIWTIFQTGKCMFVRNLGPLSRLEGHCPTWTIFQTENDCLEINNISVLPTNLRVIPSFSNKKVISTSTSLSLKYANFSSWTKALPKYLLSSHL